jgi:hypothetical protein
MDLDTFIVAVFCLIDQALREVLASTRLRQRGPQPTLHDSEVLTIEVVGAYLGLEQDKELFVYFRRHFCPFFPALGRVHRSSFVRQMANLCWVKERVWQWVLQHTTHDPAFGILDSLPLPVAHFARAPRCVRFRGEADFGRHGHDTHYGFRLHTLIAWPGVIARFEIVPASVSDSEAAVEVAAGWPGLVRGDRSYWSPERQQQLAEQGTLLSAPFRYKSRDPMPRLSALWSRLRYRIETVFGQLCDRFEIKRVWARDMWHLSSRLLRLVLSHTVCFALCQQAGYEQGTPLQLAHLLAE